MTGSYFLQHYNINQGEYIVLEWLMHSAFASSRAQLERVARKQHSVDLTLRGLRPQGCLLPLVQYQSMQ